MRVDDLVTAVRLAGRFDDNDTDYTAARIRQELTNVLHKRFVMPAVAARSGHWLKRYEVETTAGRTRYRLPHRASAIESIEFTDGGSAEYGIEGDQVVFASDPGGSRTIRVTYPVRPSLLVQEQTALVGKVTAKDEDALTVTVDTVPVVNRVTAANVVTGDRIDIIHPNGWHELAVVGVAITLSSSTFTFPAGTDLTDVETGDYVRAADQTEWPCIQGEYHQCLAELTAAAMLRYRNQKQKADSLEADAFGTERDPGPMRQFQELMEPRVKDSRQVIVPRAGILRSGTRMGTRAGVV